MNTHINVKCFIGCLLNHDIKMLLQQSPEWKEASLFQNQLLSEVLFNEKTYLGFFIDTPLSYPELKEKENILKQHLRFYCPNMQLDKNKTYLFSQIFIS